MATANQHEEEDAIIKEKIADLYLKICILCPFVDTRLDYAYEALMLELQNKRNDLELDLKRIREAERTVRDIQFLVHYPSAPPKLLLSTQPRRPNKGRIPKGH